LFCGFLKSPCCERLKFFGGVVWKIKRSKRAGFGGLKS
jgi:hypothetical protein